MNRNMGLDVIRSAAILLVLVCHGITLLYVPFYESAAMTGLSGITGVIGVELFFVLSGFLIGRIIIKDIINKPTMASLGTFYVRRWFRTLPLYYLIIIGLFAINKDVDYWKHLIFVQNYDKNALELFAVSWSLSVEEWFYLLIPLIFAGGMKLFPTRQKAVFFAICSGLIVFELILRLFAAASLDLSFVHDVRKQIHMRLDSIMIGVLLAGIKTHYGKVYARISTTRWIGVGATLGFLGLNYYMYLLCKDGNALNASYFAKTFYFTIDSLLIALILAAFEGSRRLVFKPGSAVSRIVYLFSITSYSAYLIHVYVFKVIVAVGGERLQSLPVMAAAWLFGVVGILIAGIIIFNFFEKPIMSLRDRLTLGKKTAVTPPVVAIPENLKA